MMFEYFTAYVYTPDKKFKNLIASEEVKIEGLLTVGGPNHRENCKLKKQWLDQNQSKIREICYSGIAWRSDCGFIPREKVYNALKDNFKPEEAHFCFLTDAVVMSEKMIHKLTRNDKELNMKLKHIKQYKQESPAFYRDFSGYCVARFLKDFVL